MKPSILVLGSKGMLGHAVLTYFSKKGYKTDALSREQYDITTQPIEALTPFIESHDIIINCAGVIKPQIEKNKIEQVIQVNSIFPHNLAKLCKSKGKKLFHITTDCVFSGKKGAYLEQDVFDAEDVYGMTKAAGESSLGMNLRTSIIGEEKGQSRSLLAWAQSQQGKTVNGFTNHLWNGVTTVYLAQIIEQLFSSNLYKEGTYHIHSPAPVTKAELLQIISTVYNLSLTVIPKEAPQFCDRSLSSVHDISKKIVTLTIPEQVQQMKQFFN